jgi:hypothetical protein
MAGNLRVCKEKNALRDEGEALDLNKYSVNCKFAGLGFNT